MDTKLRAINMLFGGVQMTKIVRRKFADEFKEGAVKLVTDQGSLEKTWSISPRARASAIDPLNPFYSPGVESNVR